MTLLKPDGEEQAVTAPALDVVGLAAGYGDLLAVRDVALTVRRGELVALFGRNGAGKTTSLLAIAGLLRARAGSVHLFGREMTRRPVAERIAAGVSCVQEGRRIFRRRTIAENLALGAYPLRLGRMARAERLERTYERFPTLAARRSHRADQLSGGQQQLLAIAQALMAEPKVLLLDEPSAGLAPSMLDTVMEVIVELRAAGMAIVLVEQLVGEAICYADHVVMIDGGKVVHSGPADDADSFEIARSVYLSERTARGASSRDHDSTET